MNMKERITLRQAFDFIQTIFGDVEMGEQGQIWFCEAKLCLHDYVDSLPQLYSFYFFSDYAKPYSSARVEPTRQAIIEFLDKALNGAKKRAESNIKSATKALNIASEFKSKLDKYKEEICK